ncbi:site-2 protease family protein [Candidatus Kaiserbacteria bacterium]|nr:site-2 protease family protein [Candidatus Kaiserbacteria bacterium]
MSIILFLLVLFVLVLVHEWGHFIVAKKTGMRVDEFGIGFPPKLFSVKKGETEYTFNALPIGGFVRIWGENGDEQSSTTEGGQVEAVDYSRSFSHRPKWAQALVLIAGVTMNILFAWFLFSLTYMIGVPTAVDEAVATDSAELYIAGVLPDSPASEIPIGSIIQSITSLDITIDSPTPSEFSDLVSETAPAPLSVTYVSGGEEAVVEITPVQGLVEGEEDKYIVGASLSLVEIESKSFLVAISDGAKSTWNGLAGITVGLSTLIGQSFSGDADFSQVAGPIGIVGMVGDAASFGITALLTFTAIISLNLAVINLLPFPALDGGRLVFVAIEAVTGRQIPPVWAGRVNLAGFALLMILMIAVTYNDIIRLF